MDAASFYSVSPDYLTRYGLNQPEEPAKENDGSFGSILDTAMNMINETNDYIQFAKLKKNQEKGRPICGYFIPP